MLAAVHVSLNVTQIAACYVYVTTVVQQCVPSFNSYTIAIIPGLVSAGCARAPDMLVVDDQLRCHLYFLRLNRHCHEMALEKEA